MFTFILLPLAAAIVRGMAPGARMKVLGQELGQAEYDLAMCLTEAELIALQHEETVSTDLIKHAVGRAQVRAQVEAIRRAA